MTNERMDQILRQTLSPEIPDKILNQNLKRMMEEKEMKKIQVKHFSLKKAVILTAVCCFLVGTVSVASSGKIVSLVSGFYYKEYSLFQQLEEAEANAGFTVKAVESFQNGYTFSDISVSDTKGLDEEGNVLETYKQIRIAYKKAGEDALTLYAQEAVHSHDENGRAADKTTGINGIEVKYYTDTYKWVPAGYELTAQDQANLEREDYYISEGADEISENQVSYVVWTQDGVRYSIMNVKAATSPEVLFGMAQELIMQ